MPKHNHAQIEQTNQNTNQQQDAKPWSSWEKQQADQQQAGEQSATDGQQQDQQAESINAEPLIDSRCPWTKHASGSRETRVGEWHLAVARRTASGLHGVLRVLDAHREAVANEEQPLLNDNTEGALFDAAAQLIRCLESQLEGWADKAGKA